MELKDKVASRELCQEIWDLGWRLETEFWWVEFAVRNNGNTWNGSKDYGGLTYSEKEWKIVDKKPYIGSYCVEKVGPYCWAKYRNYQSYPAPLPCEIGEVLPFRLRLLRDDYWLWQTKLKHGGTEIRYKCSFGETLAFEQIQDDSEANALANTLIRLTKEGHIKPPRRRVEYYE